MCSGSEPASGSVIPNANVTLRNEATGLERRATTNESGYYVVANLPPGYYTLTAEAGGFKKFVKTQNKLDANIATMVDATLEVGAVTETDVLLASASKAVIVAFNIRPDRKAVDLAQHEGVEIRTYTVIYELVDEMKKLMTGLLEPVFKETALGRAEVRDTFRIKGVGMIAGCRVQDGILKRDADVRVVRDGAVVYTGKVHSLRRFKEDVNEVRAGFECGLGVANFNDVKVGDVLECFTVEKVAVVQVPA